MKTPGIFYGVRAHDVWNLANHYLSTSFENTINYTCIAKDININCIICDMQNKKNKKMKTRGCMGMVIYDSCEICGEVKCDHYCLNTAYDRLIDYKNSHGCSC
jgi:hypothetical protein